MSVLLSTRDKIKSQKLILSNRTTTSVRSNKKFAMEMQQNIETKNYDKQLYVLI